MLRVAKTLVTLPLTLIWYLWYGNWAIWLVILASMAFHELGHALACMLLRIPFDVRFKLTGASVIKKNARELNYKEIFFVSSAGPLFTLILMLFCISNLMVEPQNPTVELALALNTFLLVINILPIRGLDGGKMLLTLRSLIYTRMTHEKLTGSSLYVPAAYFFSYSLYLVIYNLGSVLLGNLLTTIPQALEHGFQILMHYDLAVRLGWISLF